MSFGRSGVSLGSGPTNLGPRKTPKALKRRTAPAAAAVARGMIEERRQHLEELLIWVIS